MQYGLRNKSLLGKVKHEMKFKLSRNKYPIIVIIPVDSVFTIPLSFSLSLFSRQRNEELAHLHRVKR